jgi:hypothetical protein
MRTISALLATVLALAACEDAIGFGSSCSLEMREVRLREGGQPTDTNRTEAGGDFTEVWRFSGGGAQRIYTFRWGVSYESCRVTGPVSMSSFIDVALD